MKTRDRIGIGLGILFLIFMTFKVVRGWLGLAPKPKPEQVHPYRTVAGRGPIVPGSTHDRYLKAIEALARGFQEWIKAHPGRDPQVHFNYPTNQMVSKPYTVALAEQYMSANEDGLAMLKDVCQADESHEPTPTMIRVAMEGLGK